MSQALRIEQFEHPRGLQRLSDTLWEMPPQGAMRVPARFFASARLIEQLDAAVFTQISNVASLPGIVDFAGCMPDGHSGYGFPIGGVAAMDARSGVVSPGGIGFDINCGMRLVLTSLTWDEVRPRLRQLVDRLFKRVPAGVGRWGFVRLDEDELREIAERGAEWCLSQGYAWPEDLARTEDGGRAVGANASLVSAAAVERGLKQVGTLGAGNHYLEIQVVKPENIYDEKLARLMGLTFPGQVVIMFHCGSRGFGHQIASDYLRIFLEIMESKFGLRVPDRELACAPIESDEGQAYLGAMKCAINMSFANRQVILHRIREVFSDEFGRSPEDLGLRQVYDVAHNTAKFEEHRGRRLLVHRKGATRAFPGQPVIIGGSMETGSYLMCGQESGGSSFYSTAHGSGRVMSRHQAKRTVHGRELAQRMMDRGIYVRGASFAGLAEEAGLAYKNIDQVAEVCERAGISKRVARLIPVGNVKG